MADADSGRLSAKARQLVRFRIPLMIALLANCVFLARVPLASMLQPSPQIEIAQTTPDDLPDPDIDPDVTPNAVVPDQYPEIVGPIDPEVIPPLPDLPIPNGGSSAVDIASLPSFDPDLFETTYLPGFHQLGELFAQSAQSSTRSWDLFSQETARLAGQYVKEPKVAALPPALSGPTNTSLDPEVVATDTPTENLVVLLNASDSGGVVRFVVNNNVVSLQPGEAREFKTPGDTIVEYHRGGEFGSASHLLTDGRFVFRVTQRGWTLMKRADDAE